MFWICLFSCGFQNVDGEFISDEWHDIIESDREPKEHKGFACKAESGPFKTYKAAENHLIEMYGDVMTEDDVDLMMANF